MDLFPLWNSLRVAAISTGIVFFAGVFAAYYIARLPRLVKGVLDVVLTLPLVLPPTVVGWLLLVLLGSWWGVRRRDRAAEQEAEAEHLLAGAGEPNALPRRWVTLFWSQRSSIAESRWAGMVESSLIIGSDAAQCDLCLPDRKVSPQHCVLAAQGDALLVQPLSDRAKVYVNGERIDGEHRLQNNDTLRIGKTTVRLVL